MSTRDSIRRAAFALLAAVACQNALAQSGLRVRNIRVDVAPLRANAGEPDRLVGAAGDSRSNLPKPWRAA